MSGRIWYPINDIRLFSHINEFFYQKRFVA